MKRKHIKKILITIEKSNLDIIDNYCKDNLIPRSNLFEKASLLYVLEHGYDVPFKFINEDDIEQSTKNN